MKRNKYFRIPIFTFLTLYCFCINGQEVNYKSADFGLKNNPVSVYRVNYNKVPTSENTPVYQFFNEKGYLIKHIYLFDGFSENRDTLIYNSDNRLAKIITTVDGYNYKEKHVYKYLDDTKVEVTSFNNSPQNGSDGKKMIKSGISINSYNGSRLTKKQTFSSESDYKKNTPSSEELYTYDGKNNLIEKKIILDRYLEIFTYNDKGVLTEKQYHRDGNIDDIIYYKNYEFDDKGNWLKRSVESKNNPSINYTISRMIAYHEKK